MTECIIDVPLSRAELDARALLADKKNRVCPPHAATILFRLFLCAQRIGKKDVFDNVVRVGIKDYFTVPDEDTQRRALRLLRDDVKDNGIRVLRIPYGITYICRMVFCNCDSLVSVTIPLNVTHIGIGAFQDCVSLTSIKIPDTITHINMQAFANCQSLVTAVIPNTVKRIQEHTFHHCISLVSVHIPNSVTHIEDDAFEYCSSLATVVFPTSLRSIGCGAFRNCVSLTSVVIPKSVGINLWAFKGCTFKIETRTSVTDIGENASESEVHLGKV